jgi:hypothetical protein
MGDTSILVIEDEPSIAEVVSLYKAPVTGCSW